MSPDLAALFAAHKTAILGGGAALVTGLALLQRRKKATAAIPAGAGVPGTIPAAAVVSTPSMTGTGYNSSATDLYSALQPELEAIRQTQGTGTTIPSKPIASTLFSPLGTNQYVRYKNGTIAEIESDGSVYGISAGEPFDWSTKNITALPWVNQMEGGPAYSDRLHNLAAAGGHPLTG